MKPKKTVIISVNKGLIEMVSLPKGVKLIALDYDVDGEPEEDLGCPYLRLEWS